MAGFAYIGVRTNPARSATVDADLFTTFIVQVKTILGTPAPFDAIIRQQIASRFGAQWQSESDYWIKNTLYIGFQEFTPEEVSKIEAAFPEGIAEDPN